MPVAGGHAVLEKLTRRHAVRISPHVGCSVEEASYAVGEVVGFDSVLSASRMNRAVVIFLDDVVKVDTVVEKGVVIRDTFTPVLPLVSPAKRITVSNAPPFIKTDDLARELSRYGQLMSPIKMVPLECKSPKLRHVMCPRRHVVMILKDNTADLNLTFSFKVDGFTYVVFATSDTMKCFGCGEEGHLVLSCPRRPAPGPADPAPGPDGPGGTADPAPGPDGPGGSADRAAEPPPGGSDSGVAPPAADSDSAGVQQSAETAQVTETDTQEKEGNVEHSEGVNEGHAQSNDKPDNNKQTGKKKGSAKGKGCSQEVINVADVDLAENLSEEMEIIKGSSKRKSSAHKEQSESKAKKLLEDLSDEDEDDEEECEWTASQAEELTLYPLDKIKKFLQDTKGIKAVKTEQFFPDLRGFIRSVAWLRTDTEGFTKQEGYRLKKLVTKVRAQLIEDDD